MNSSDIGEITFTFAELIIMSCVDSLKLRLVKLTFKISVSFIIFKLFSYVYIEYI